MTCRTRTQYTVEQKIGSATHPKSTWFAGRLRSTRPIVWKDNLSLEVDYTDEHSTTTRPGNQDVSQQHFFYSGYRWDI